MPLRNSCSDLTSLGTASGTLRKAASVAHLPGEGCLAPLQVHLAAVGLMVALLGLLVAQVGGQCTKLRTLVTASCLLVTEVGTPVALLGLLVTEVGLLVTAVGTLVAAVCLLVTQVGTPVAPVSFMPARHVTSLHNSPGQ